MNIEKEIEEFLSVRGAVRTTNLIEVIMNQHKIQRGIERGYSKKTQYRKLKQLSAQGVIQWLSDEEIESFGILKKDGRAKYIILKISGEQKKHFDEAVFDIRYGKRDEVYIALKEILLYKSKFLLNPKQLDLIVSALKFDEIVASFALEILHESVVLKNILPLNEAVLLSNLKELLLKLRENSEFRTQIGQIVHILGYFQDDFVIEQLAFDAPRFDDKKIWIDDYHNGIMTDVMEKNRSRLYELEKSFISRGNEKAAEKIHEIRDILLNPTEPKIKRRGYLV